LPGWFFWTVLVLVLSGTGFELRASHLESRCSTAWATPLVHFALGFFCCCYWGFWRCRGGWCLMNYLPVLASHLNPPSFGLPSS
jgi:hypothetical protein